MSYLARLQQLTATRRQLCVGIDPMPQVLAAWGLDNDVAGLERCARSIVAELGAQVAVFKPQSAFFEPFGAAGIAVLERVLNDISQAGALSILDVKRGDIGSSMAGYSRAYLDPGSPLASDAITLSPFLGVDSLTPAIELAAKNDRGCYVLARTSNPESATIQLSDTGKGSISQSVIDRVSQLDQDFPGTVGIVVGGTHPDLGCDLTGFPGSILIPGIGAQGGKLSHLRDRFGSVLSLILPTSSRGVIGGGQGQLRARFDELVESSDDLFFLT